MLRWKQEYEQLCFKSESEYSYATESTHREWVYYKRRTCTQVLAGLRTWSSSALTKQTALEVNSLISMKKDEAKCYNHKQCCYRAHPQQSALWCHSSWVWCQTPCHRTSNISTAQIQKVFLSSCVECSLTLCGLLLCQLPLVFTVHWLLLQTGTATALRTHSTQAQHTIHSHSNMLRTRSESPKQV